MQLAPVGELDRVIAAAIPITSSLAKHTNDLMTSFYFQTLSGFAVEFGWGGREVDDATWQAEAYRATSVWGHRHPLPAR
jgi:3,4-dihydroxy-9,10-secoandrosta-1,3,5(10)-triene-9,17-dione 4,5-dioxygenase